MKKLFSALIALFIFTGIVHASDISFYETTSALDVLDTIGMMRKSQRESIPKIYYGASAVYGAMGLDINNRGYNGGVAFLYSGMFAGLGILYQNGVLKTEYEREFYNYKSLISETSNSSDKEKLALKALDLFIEKEKSEYQVLGGLTTLFGVLALASGEMTMTGIGMSGWGIYMAFFHETPTQILVKHWKEVNEPQVSPFFSKDSLGINVSMNF